MALERRNHPSGKAFQPLVARHGRDRRHGDIKARRHRRRGAPRHRIDPRREAGRQARSRDAGEIPRGAVIGRDPVQAKGHRWLCHAVGEALEQVRRDTRPPARRDAGGETATLHTPSVPLRRRQQPLQLVVEAALIEGCGGDDAGLRLGDQRRIAASLGDEDRQPSRQRLHDDAAGGFVVGRQGECVGRAQEPRHVIAPAQEPGALCDLEPPREALEAAVAIGADDEQRDAPRQTRGQGGHRLQQPIQALGAETGTDEQQRDGALAKPELAGEPSPAIGLAGRHGVFSSAGGSPPAHPG